MVFSRLLKMAQRNGLIDRESYVAQYLALALFTIGVARTLGSDDLLAAFAAGQPPHPVVTYDPLTTSIRQDQQSTGMGTSKQRRTIKYSSP